MAKRRTSSTPPAMAAPRGRAAQRKAGFRAGAALLVAVVGIAAWWTLRTTRSKHPSLLLITIDTLRADHVGVYGATTGATPTLDALAAEGVRFDQAQTAVPLTGPSHATILTGQYPPVHGVRGNVVFSLGPRYPTLATLLKRHGYRTAAFVGAYPVAAAFGFGQGFDTFNEDFHETSPIDQGAERRANEVADAAIPWLAGIGEAPFFAWLHFYDPHAPYDPPSPYRESFADRPYDGEIAFADSQIRRVLDALGASGRDKDTIVVALADHGEGLGDHHERTHAVLIYQSTLRVPMIVAGPSVPHARVVASRVGTIDVLPTAMALLGWEVDKSLLGRDLRPVMAGRTIPDDPLYAESLFGHLNCHWATLRGWIEGDWKLIAGAEPELYNLIQDPGERRNLAKEAPGRVRSMSEKLQRGLQRLAPAGDRAQTNPITPEQQERLRSLGYAAGSASGALDDRSLPDPATHVELYDRLQQASAASGPLLSKAFGDVVAITRLDPANPFAFGTLASMAYRYGSLAVAARAFARTLELDPDHPGARQNYGKLLRELRRYGDSERELRIALAQTTDDDSHARINLADTLVASRKTREAETLVDAVLSREPKNPEALGAKARLLLSEGRPADALPLFERATATSDPESLIELAGVYLMTGDPAKARDEATEALRRTPGHPWAMAVLGSALVAEGQSGAGVQYLQQALASGPRRPVVWETLADGFESAGQMARASNCRRQAAAITRASLE